MKGKKIKSVVRIKEGKKRFKKRRKKKKKYEIKKRESARYDEKKKSLTNFSAIQKKKYFCTF
jgi:hypothetical protein